VTAARGKLPRPLRVGTRPSLLARTQAEIAARRLGVPYELVVVRTSGDERTSDDSGESPAVARIEPVPSPGRGTPTRPQRADKARFVKELEEALLAGEIDVAVHSAKDVPGELPDGLVLAAAAGRADPADVLVMSAAVAAKRSAAAALGALPAGARVGTSSRRRTAQLLAARPDIAVVPLRGNVDTRLRRLSESELDAVVLAAAGLDRLGNALAELAPRATHCSREHPVAHVPADTLAMLRLDPPAFLPAPGQGTLVYETRRDDHSTLAVCAAANDSASWRELLAERALVRALEATCDTPLAALARHEGDELQLSAWAGSPDGSTWVQDRGRGSRDRPEELGELVAERMRAAGALEVMAGMPPNDVAQSP